jgi:arylsulfatase A-like enzyme
VDRVPVSHLDIVPTALAAAGVAPPQNLDGANQLDRWAGGNEASARLVLWRFFGGEAMPATRSWAVREGRWKLSSHWSSAADAAWLVDLDADVSERENLTATHPDVAARLTAAWEAWNATLPEPAGPDPAADLTGEGGERDH